MRTVAARSRCGPRGERRVIPLLATALGVALLTWSLGWWGVVVAALVAGAVLWRRRGVAWLVALAAITAWGALILVNSVGGRFAALPLCHPERSAQRGVEGSAPPRRLSRSRRAAGRLRHARSARPVRRRASRGTAAR